MLLFTESLRHRQRGLALIYVLIFLMVFALLGMSMLQKNHLHTQLIGSAWQKQQLSVMVERFEAQLEANLRYRIPSCVIPVADTAKLIQKEPAWWRNVSCTGNFQHFQYYYVIEFLGEDNCTFVPESDGTYRGIAYFYRVSLQMTIGKEDADIYYPRVILQSIYLKKGAPIEACHQERFAKREGRQSSNWVV